MSRRQKHPFRFRPTLDVLENRLNPDGAFDTSFDGDGVRCIAFANANLADQAHDVVIQPDGKIVLAGSTQAVVGNTTVDFAAARLNPDGSLDTTFDGNGEVYHSSISLRFDAGNAVAQPDGKLIVAGTTVVPVFLGDFSQARLNADGTVDPTFGVNGRVTLNINGNDSGSAVALQSDGKIVMAGFAAFGSSGAGATVAFVRFNTNGTLDPTFDGDGIAQIDLTNTGDLVSSIAIQPDGKIVFGSTIGASGFYDLGVGRLNTNGSLDTTFNGTGLLRLSLANHDQVDAILLQSDGKILAAGMSENRGAAIRVNPDGTLDTSFDGDGILLSGGTGVGQMRNYDAVTRQQDGKYVFAGMSTNGAATGTDFGIARFHPDGSPDTSFDGDGVSVVAIGAASAQDVARAVSMTWDGRIVVAGDTLTSTSDFAVIRLLSDGSLDPSFDGDGKATVDFAGTQYGYVDTATPDTINSSTGAFT